MQKLFIVLGIACLTIISQHVNASDENGSAGWKAGVARIVITPEQPIWMAGYGNRDRVAEDKLHDLWAKALALQDSNGRRCVLITTDLCAIPKDMSDRIRNELKLKYNLSKAQIIINCSHTHSGPVLQNSLANIYPLNAEQSEKIKIYSAKLEKQIIALVGTAFKSLEPATVYTGNGMARFQVNRRNNNEESLLLQPELKGPNDYAVPVIKVANKSGAVIAIAFGYACHNTVLNGYQWSGDYAGFAQLELEKMNPGSIALFFQGAGADENPLPRRTIPLAKQYGKELAYAVEKVLNEDMRKLSPQMAASYSEVELSFNTPPTREELVKMAKDSSVAYIQRSAQHMLNQMDKGEKFRRSYPYPVLVWKLGEQAIIALGGELVVNYAVEIKKLFGVNTFVLGYSNDVMSYIPSATILRESNDKGDFNIFYDPVNHSSIAYEGGLSSQMAYGLPGTWASNIESVILSEVQRMAKRAGVPLTEYK
ncbi:MAG: neutral/alkaline non-lysosomal ceramidase N-terminal domain-containing protein [Ginsengibacter sp.]